MADNVSVRDDAGAGRYEVIEGDEVVGFLNYRLRDGILALVHTEIDAGHSGRGLAARLVTFALEDARRRGLSVLPYCPYVRSFIDEHATTYLDLVPERRRAQFGWAT